MSPNGLKTTVLMDSPNLFWVKILFERENGVEGPGCHSVLSCCQMSLIGLETSFLMDSASIFWLQILLERENRVGGLGCHYVLSCF